MNDARIEFVIGKDGFDVLFGGGVKLGQLVREVDGYYVFYPELSNGGAWTPWVMKAIAFKMDELNLPWDDEIARHLAANRNETTNQNEKQR